MERALDLFVYAPLGLALVAREDLPGLVHRGRRQVEEQVRVARMVGELAVAQGRKEARGAAARASGALGGLLAGGRRPAGDTPPRTHPPPGPVRGEEKHGPLSSDGRPGAPAPSGAHLAIPGYDSLSASQVVQRLAGLTAEELDAVLAYEQATRGRRTVLNRIAQLRSDRAW
jgi:hypothetical protein